MLTQMLLLISLIWLIYPFNSYSSSNCRFADEIVSHVKELHDRGESIVKQKTNLKLAIEHCPRNAYAHTNYAMLLRKEQKLSQAIYHYEKATQINARLKEAWYGLAEIYYHQNQMPLSLQTYGKVCQYANNDAELETKAKRKVKELLADDRYKIPHKGEVFGLESLLLVAGNELKSIVSNQCGFRATIKPITMLTFKNIIYDEKRQMLTSDAKQQLKNLAQMIKQQKPTLIEIRSYHPTGTVHLPHIKAELEKHDLPASLKIVTKHLPLPKHMPRTDKSRIDVELE